MLIALGAMVTAAVGIIIIALANMAKARGDIMVALEVKVIVV